MRMAVLVLVCACASFVPARAGAQTPAGAGSGTEVALGPHVIRREHSSRTHVGGGLTVARRWGWGTGVLEAGGTRRDGHNDWRVLAGTSTAIVEGPGARLYVQGLAGALIRSSKAGFAVMPGVGVDVRTSGARAIRLQLDVPVERSESRTVAGVRASVWLVFSPSR